MLFYDARRSVGRRCPRLQKLRRRLWKQVSARRRTEVVVVVKRARSKGRTMYAVGLTRVLSLPFSTASKASFFYVLLILFLCAGAAAGLIWLQRKRK